MRVNGPELWFSRWGWGEGNGNPLQYSCLEKSHGLRCPVGCSPWGQSLRVGHDWVTSLSLSFIGDGNGNPLQCSCLENPRDGRAWWAAVYGVTQSWTQLKRLCSSSRWGWSLDACSEMGQLGFLVCMVRSETEIRDYHRVFGLRSVGMEAPTEMRKLIVWVKITGFIRSFILTILRVWGISGTSKWRHQIGSWTHKLGNWKRGSSGDIQNVVATMWTQVSELWLHLGVKSSRYSPNAVQGAGSGG